MNLGQIKKLSKEYDDTHATKEQAQRVELTPRFKALVEKFGASAVSAATGLREGTVLQYTRCKVIPVSEYAVIKAETILFAL